MSWRLNRRTAGLHPIYLYHLHIDSRWFSHSAEKKTLSKWVHLHFKKKRGEQKTQKTEKISWESKRLTLLNCKLKQFKHIEWTPKHIQFFQRQAACFSSNFGQAWISSFHSSSVFFFSDFRGGCHVLPSQPEIAGVTGQTTPCGPCCFQWSPMRWHWWDLGEKSLEIKRSGE